MSNKKKKDQSYYHCTAEWHFAKINKRSPWVDRLYNFGLSIAKDGYFYCSGYRLADYFKCKRGVIYNAIKKLVKLGFWIPSGSYPDGRKIYKVLYHKEWAVANPGRCTAKNEVYEDLGESKTAVPRPLDGTGGRPLDGTGVVPVKGLKSPSIVSENKSPSILNPSGLDAPLSLKTDGQDNINYLPLADMIQVVEDVTGSDEAHFHKKHFPEYRKLFKLFGREAVLDALKEYCENMVNPGYNIKDFISSGFKEAASQIIISHQMKKTKEIHENN